MTREEINQMTRAIGKYVECCMPKKVLFALLVFDEETGRASLVATMPDGAVYELAGMMLENGHDVTVNRKKG